MSPLPVTLSVMNKFLRKPSLVLGAALFISFVGAVDTSYAQATFQQLVSVPDAPTSDPQSPQNPDAAADQASPDGIALDDSGITSVDAKSIALVSLAARQVELAKSPDGAKSVALDLINENYGWNKTQVSCLNQLWNGESHWNFKAHNYRSGAHGIAQALPATKMEVISTDWRTNPVTQIKWGLAYIKARYSTPCKALRTKHWRGYY